jgi:hypothetical protein
MKEERGTLKPGEYHPAADSAMLYIRSIPLSDLYTWLEAFSSCAIEDNRLGEICAETLNRIMKGEPVSDRYLVSLAWAIASPKYKGETHDKKDSD